MENGLRGRDNKSSGLSALAAIRGILEIGFGAWGIYGWISWISRGVHLDGMRGIAGLSVGLILYLCLLTLGILSLFRPSRLTTLNIVIAFVLLALGVYGVVHLLMAGFSSPGVALIPVMYQLVLWWVPGLVILFTSIRLRTLGQSPSTTATKNSDPEMRKT